MDAVKSNLSDSAKQLLNQIAKANGNLGSLGSLLFKIQDGTVAIENPPTKYEWSFIWAAYKVRKATTVTTH